MSTQGCNPPDQSRWFKWVPKTRILDNSLERAPSKPSKHASAGFGGVASAESPETEVRSNPNLARAAALLDRLGVRHIVVDGINIIGIWSDLDGPEIRSALATVGHGAVPVRYLDGPDVPLMYKVRRISGEPLPMQVLPAMQAELSEPWRIRDAMLRDMGWKPNGSMKSLVRERGSDETDT